MQDRAATDVRLSLADRCGPRISIEDVYPTVDAGRFAVKRIAGETVEVWADIFRDGHAVLAAELMWRGEAQREWSRVPMRFDGNDRWTATFSPPQPGRYLYAIEAWTDPFGTWRHDFLAKRDAGQKVSLEIEEGRGLAALIKPRDPGHARVVREARRISTSDDPTPLLSEALAEIARGTLRADIVRGASYPLVADRPRARASAW